MYGKLGTKVNAIKVLSTSELVFTTYYNSDKQNLEKKIESIDKKIRNNNGIVTNTDLNTKLTNVIDIENKLSGISYLATKTAQNMKDTDIGNKMPHTNSFIAINEFNRLMKINFYARMEKPIKCFAGKTDVNNALDLVDKIERKII